MVGSLLVVMLERAMLYPVTILLKVTTLAYSPRAERSFTMYLALGPPRNPPPLLLASLLFCTSQLTLAACSTFFLVAQAFQGLHLNFIQTQSLLLLVTTLLCVHLLQCNDAPIRRGHRTLSLSNFFHPQSRTSVHRNHGRECG